MKVAAVVVTEGVDDYFVHAMDSVMNQTIIPQKVYIVDVSKTPNNLSQIVESANQGAAASGLKTSIILYQQPKAGSFATAVNKLVNSDYFDDDIDWIWMLHSDSEPETQCLEKLVKYAQTDDSIGLIGARQLDPENDNLLNVGWKSTKFGQRVAMIGKEEIDQGQYDSIEDVFAVSVNGSLIRTTTLEEIGGLNEKAGLNSSLDLARRVHLHAERVVVSDALVKHWQVNFRRKSNYQERKFNLIYRLSTVFLPLLPGMWVYYFVMSLFTSVRQLYSNNRGTISVFMGSYAALFSFRAIWVGRRLNALAKVSPRKVLNEFYATRKEVSLIKKDTRLEKAAALWKDYQPTLLETKSLKATKRKTRIAFYATLALLVVLSAIHFAGAIPALISGGHFVADNLKPSTAGFLEAFNSATSGYTDAGFGMNAPVDPVMLLIALLTALTQSVQLTLTLIVLLSTVLSGLTAWAASGAATRNNSARMIATLVWATLPVFSTAVDSGRVGAIIAHILLPLVPLLIARGLGKSATDFDIGMPKLNYNFPLLGIVLAFLLGAAPVLAPLFVALFLIAGVYNRRFWFALIPSLVLNSWTLIWVLTNVQNGSWQVFLGDIVKQDGTPKTIITILLGTNGVFSVTSLICLLVILASAVHLLTSTRTARIILSRCCWLLSISCIVAAYIFESVSSVNSSVLIDLAYLGFGTTILIFYKQRQEITRQVVVSYCLIVAGILGLSAVSVFLEPSTGLHTVHEYSMPAVAKKINQEVGNPRILVVDVEGNDKFKYSVLKGRTDDYIYKSDASTIMLENLGLDEKDATLRQVMATMIAAPNSGVIKALEDLGIEALYVPNQEDETLLTDHLELLKAIDSTPGTVRIMQGDQNAFWRLPSPSELPENVTYFEQRDENGQVVGKVAKLQENVYWDNSAYDAALHALRRYVLILLILTTLICYAFLGMPFGSRRVISNDV
jgi:GT2 family glycosyltransferase